MRCLWQSYFEGLVSVDAHGKRLFLLQGLAQFFCWAFPFLLNGNTRLPGAMLPKGTINTHLAIVIVPSFQSTSMLFGTVSANASYNAVYRSSSTTLSQADA